MLKFSVCDIISNISTVDMTSLHNLIVRLRIHLPGASSYIQTLLQYMLISMSVLPLICNAFSSVCSLADPAAG